MRRSPSALTSVLAYLVLRYGEINTCKLFAHVLFYVGDARLGNPSQTNVRSTNVSHKSLAHYACSWV